MQLTVFGAPGLTGGCIVSQALERGHRVTAFVRSAAALPDRHPQARRDRWRHRQCRSKSTRRQRPGRHPAGTRRQIGDPRTGAHASDRRTSSPRCRKFGVRRLINVSGHRHQRVARERSARIGKLAIANGVRALDRDAFRDKETQDALIRNSDLDWINVCPPWLTNGPRTGVYRFGAICGRADQPDLARRRRRLHAESAHRRRRSSAKARSCSISCSTQGSLQVACTPVSRGGLRVLGRWPFPGT